MATKRSSTVRLILPCSPSGDHPSLDDFLIVCAIYPSIAKKSAYPCPPSLSKRYLSFMKYVKRM